jgi:hypothetical protein
MQAVGFGIERDAIGGSNLAN